MFSIQEDLPLGLDISDYTLRLINLKKRGSKFSILSQNEINIPDNCIVDGEIRDLNLFASAIKRLIGTARGKRITTNKIISVLPETKTFIKLLKVKADLADDLPKKIIQELTRHVPFSVDEIYFDWQLLQNFKPGKTNDILVGAAPIQTVNNYASALKAAGLVTIALEIEAVAIMRSLASLRSNYSPQEPTHNAKIIIDIGATRTGMILFDHNMIYFTISLPISGNEITQKISEKLEIDLKKAEKAKILCGLDKTKCKGILKVILLSTMTQLAKKIEEAIYFYEELCGQPGVVKEIIITGGGSNLLDIDSYLYERFKIPVSKSSPLVNISKIEKNIGLNKNNIQSYSTAIGLALRGFEI